MTYILSKKQSEDLTEFFNKFKKECSLALDGLSKDEIAKALSPVIITKDISNDIKP